MTLSSNQVSRTITHQIPARRFPRLARDAEQLVMRYAVQDYAVESAQRGRALLGDFVPLREAHEHELSEAFLPLSDSRHYRMRTIGSYAVGQYEFCGLADGFFIFIGDVELDAPLSRYMSAPDMLRVRLASNGDGEYVPQHGAPLSFEAPNAVVIIEPSGQPTAETTFAGNNRFVHVFIHRQALKSLYAGAELELPPVVQAFIDGDLQQTVARPLPLCAALLRCLEDVHTCPLDGHRRRLFLQSKAVEIICQALEALEHGDSFGTAMATRLTARGVAKAQTLLAENFVTPPTLENLALDVGLSRSALCAGFRQIMGRSVSEYIQDLRMRQALAMLSESDASIAEIAYAVGYNRASSFTVAVHRHFGATPTELRRKSVSTLS